MSCNSCRWTLTELQFFLFIMKDFFFFFGFVTLSTYLPTLPTYSRFPSHHPPTSLFLSNLYLPYSSYLLNLSNLPQVFACIVRTSMRTLYSLFKYSSTFLTHFPTYDECMDVWRDLVVVLFFIGVKIGL